MDRIETNPDICGGKPVIKGTRIMVRNVLSQLSAGYSFADVKESYPGIADEDIQAALNYAVQLVDDVRLIAGV